VEKFDQKKEKLMSILLQESCEVAQKIKANKLIEESIKATREEN
jgi:NTP pyrophosphatase (non-canonical NTP hydrolase)